MKPIARVAALVAFLAFALVAPPAQAEPENPLVHGSVSVQLDGAGKITGSGIDCGSDCSDTAAWPDNELPPKNRLTATPYPGWSFIGWTNCAPVNGKPLQCDVTYSEFDAEPAIARFRDVTAPTVRINSVSPGQKAGDRVTVDAIASDGDGVTKVEFLIDGQWRGSVFVSPWTLEMDLSDISEGTHQLTVKAYDPSLNSTTTENWPIEVDHSGPQVNLNSPAPATNEAAPRFSFGSPSADFNSAECAIQKQGEIDARTSCERDAWYSEDAPTEGAWEFVVVAEDEVGNLTTVTHPFVVDRTAPDAAFTSGPADGSVVDSGNVKYAWSATDGLPLTQLCAWDGGEEAPCNGSATRGLTAGTHTFQAVITDQAGNETVLKRTVTAKKDGTIPDPDTDDKTAPVIKLAAPKQKLKGLGKALRLNVRCSEACSGKVTVTGKRGVKFAGRVALSKAGVAKLKLKTSAKVRKRLKKISPRSLKSRPLKLAATAVLADSAGNRGKASLKFKVKG
ncbi:MAG: hypothetical protein J0H98_00010 [Solirubrobacterales bacterium]|nr:hypothetical protein [Solirubrobacterales bacterium]